MSFFSDIYDELWQFIKKVSTSATPKHPRPTTVTAGGGTCRRIRLPGPSAPAFIGSNSRKVTITFNNTDRLVTFEITPVEIILIKP